MGADSLKNRQNSDAFIKQAKLENMLTSKCVDGDVSDRDLVINRYNNNKRNYVLET